MEISILTSILIFLHTAGRKTRRRKKGRRTQAIAKRYAFHANVVSKLPILVTIKVNESNVISWRTKIIKSEKRIYKNRRVSITNLMSHDF